ncbi:MAG: hypothetical protein IJI46_04625 [Erysipelotrichaceae bacterium]|nr:hypothetical protein [Erysipelotrichaceae bacterium]
MKIYLKDLMSMSSRRIYPIDIERYDVEGDIYLRRLEDVTGEIIFYYDASDILHIEYALKGKMICPCAISLEDVEVPFELNEDEKVVHKQDEDGFFINENMEAEQLVHYIVSPEVPIKVVKKEKIEYSRGDGWSFVSEEDYKASKKDEIDPRLQKLKEYRFEEED